MDRQRVLVVFSSRSGSTAGTADLIASVLGTAGLAVDCRPAGEVADLAAYRAVVLGSGVFVPRRASDGGGFLARHAVALRSLPVWLFSDGPIGGGRERGDGAAAGSGTAECPAVTVARAIGARGVATFGTLGMPDGDDPVASLLPADAREVRAWARTIAAVLAPTGTLAHRPTHRRPPGHEVAVGH
jgi:menaquinone-dependent protoporphyrinogen oxidase